jgi:hypothetical protein
MSHNRKYITQALSQLPDDSVDYYKGVYSIFVGEIEPQPGIIYSEPLDEDGVNALLQEYEYLIGALKKGTAGLKNYIRTGNESAADRYIQQLVEIRQAAAEIEVMVQNMKKDPG